MQRHSDGKILLAIRPGAPTAAGDIEVWEVTPTGTPSATQLTSVLTSTDEMALPDIWINQNTSDLWASFQDLLPKPDDGTPEPKEPEPALWPPIGNCSVQ